MNTNYHLYWQGVGYPQAPPQSQSTTSWPSPPAQGSAQPQVQSVSGSGPAPQVPHQLAEKVDLHLKILNPSCKKEGDLHILRGLLPDDMESPDQLKHAMATQYGELLPNPSEMEIGYFHKTNKFKFVSEAV